MTDAQQNGPSDGGKYIDQINPDDPEYQRQMRRPAEVKEDLNQMDSRKRVSLILNSQAFKDELEHIVHEQMASGNHPASLLALQQISELILPQSRFNQGGGIGKAMGAVIPIADIRGVDSLNYNKGEKMLRCKLASLYRLVDLSGWTHGIYNHITARINQDQEHFLINPFGLLYSEVSAASLVKVDMRGEILDSGSTMLGINKAGYTIHSAIHQARPDIRCIIHLHTHAAVSVSVMKCGLLPISQEACICGDVSYFDYTGILVDPEQREALARALGPVNKVMMLRNHGVLACGESIEEAYHYAVNLMAACEAQVRVIPLGLDNIQLISDDVRRQTFEQANQGGGGVDSEGESRRRFKVGEMEFEALMRQLDNTGFRTGYVYREPIIRQTRKDRANSDVEVPPSSSSFAYSYEDDLAKFMSPIKAAMEKHKRQFKSEWLTTPNVYMKEEIDEIGTPNPKKITKWKQDGSPDTTSTPVRMESPNQFAPQGGNPKELLQKHKEIRKEYYEEKITAGPQSKILEGTTWEEAQRIKDGNLSGTGDQVIMVGAASKGIIQRDHQHNAVVYKTYYQPNPFGNMTEDDLNKYKQEVEAKQKGGDVLVAAIQRQRESYREDLVPGPDGQLISTEQREQIIREQQDGKSVTTTTVTTTVINGDGDKPASPTKSTDSASGGDTLDDRSSKEGSPSREVPQQSPTKEKKKKKFRIPSFSKKKDKKKEK